VLDPKNKDSNGQREPSPQDRQDLSYPGAEINRSLSTELPFTLTVRDISIDSLERLLAEIAPDISQLVSGEIRDLVEESRCLKGEQLRSKYFSSTPITIYQNRTFVLDNGQAPSEKLHSVKIIDERCQPENPTIEVFKLGLPQTSISVRFSFDTLPSDARWALVNRIGSLMGVPDACASFQRAPREAEHQCSTGSTLLEVGPGVIIETLSTTQPLPGPKAFADRQPGRASWIIDSLEYSQPDYEEQSELLKLIDPREFEPVKERNLLSSLLLHTARMYATQEGEISAQKINRASRHINEPLTLSFERWMVLGDPDGEDALMSDDLLSLLSSEADGNQDWQPPEDTSAWAETPEAFLPDSSPDLFTDAQFSPFEDEQSSAEPQEAGIEDIPDFGTRSRVTLEKRSSPYGQYRISFSSDAAGLVTDQVNDDSFFNKDAPTIRVDFLDDKNARSRWRLLSKLHGQLSESMAVPEDEAHNLDTIERDFSSSDISASGEQVALYLGRMRVIASRG
jgi:hypothetical protein